MLRFLRVLWLLVLLLGSHVFSQENADIAIQQGHSNAITSIAIDPNNKFFATYGDDSKIVIWDSKSNNQFSSIQFTEKVIGFTFGETSTQLFIKIKSKTLLLDISTMKIQVANAKRIKYRSKDNSIGKTLLVKINGPNIQIINALHGSVVKSATSDYFDQPFTSVCLSDVQQKIFASSIDGKIYVFDFNLKLLNQWHEHNWHVNDLVLSPNEDFLYSVSSDRSVIKWNVLTGEPVSRMSSKSYPTYGISFHKNQLYFGDQIGHLKTVKLDNSRLECTGLRPSNHPILYTHQFNDSSIMYTGANNKITFNSTSGENTTIKITKTGYTNINHSISKKLGLYKLPFSAINSIDISSNEHFLIYSTNITAAKLNYIKIVDIRNPEKIKTSKKLYIKDEYITNDIFFLNDSVFVSSSENSGINVWRINNQDLKNISIKHFPLKETKTNDWNNQVARFNNKTIAYFTGKKLCVHNLYSQEILQIEINTQSSIYSYQNNSIILSQLNGDFQIVTKNNGKLELSPIFKGHTEPITSVTYSNQNNQLFTTSTDGSVRVWNDSSFNLTLIIIPIGLNQSIYLTEDNYYMINDTKLNNFGFKVDDNYYYPEQFDPIFNRPDIILERLGYADSSLISAYHQAYLKRLKKMGFTEDMLKDDFHLPELEIANYKTLPSTTEQGSITLDLKMKDDKYKLDRINIWVNDVAIYGTDGISLRQLDVKSHQTKLSINLANGKNKIQASVLNQSGAESYKTTFEVISTAGKVKPDLYLVTIGESKFKQSTYNLTYAAKDANDITALLSKSKAYQNIKTKTLVNEQVTRENVLKLRPFIEQADIDDQVMIFIAGHGVLDANLDYFFATYDMDFSNPSDKGLAYEDLEGLLDGIKPLKKTLIIDACHSGEIDKDEVELSQTNSDESGDIQFRAVGNTVAPKLGMQNTSQLTKQLFTDLRKGTGTTVISSAGGMEFAMESADWNNGLFTYCLLSGITSGDADINNDGEIWLSEIQNYLQNQVPLLSKGLQQPTSRIENQVVDFRIW